jgi:hypothetical protein
VVGPVLPGASASVGNGGRRVPPDIDGIGAEKSFEIANGRQWNGSRLASNVAEDESCAAAFGFWGKPVHMDVPLGVDFFEKRMPEINPIENVVQICHITDIFRVTQRMPNGFRPAPIQVYSEKIKY